MLPLTLAVSLALAPPTRAQVAELTPQTTLAAAEAPGFALIEAAPVADAPSVLLRDAHVMTATGAVYERGWVLLEDGVISALGEGEPPPAPGVATLSLEGRWITPGLIDPHSHMGVYGWPAAEAHDDGNESPP